MSTGRSRSVLCALAACDREAAETVEFALDGRQYEIDLCGRHAGQLREDVKDFVGPARPVARRRSTTAARSVTAHDPARAHPGRVGRGAARAAGQPVRPRPGQAQHPDQPSATDEPSAADRPSGTDQRSATDRASATDRSSATDEARSAGPSGRAERAEQAEQGANAEGPGGKRRPARSEGPVGPADQAGPAALTGDPDPERTRRTVDRLRAAGEAAALRRRHAAELAQAAQAAQAGAVEPPGAAAGGDPAGDAVPVMQRVRAVTDLLVQAVRRRGGDDPTDNEVY